MPNIAKIQTFARCIPLPASEEVDGAIATDAGIDHLRGVAGSVGDASDEAVAETQRIGAAISIRDAVAREGPGGHQPFTAPAVRPPITWRWNTA